MLRILVSGAAGFIGSHLCERLAGDGHFVVGVDNFITGAEGNLRELARSERFQLIRGDVSKPGWTLKDRFDAVLHLASLASPREYLTHPLETLETGSTGTRNLLEIARREDARFLLTSTSEVYGDPAVHPQTEDYWGNVNPVGVRSCYDESKRFAEAMTMAYHRKFGLRTSIARVFNTYGPRMKTDDGRVVPQFIEQVLKGQALTVYGDGSQTRSFCYVSDLVEGLVRLLFADFAEPVNLGNPDERTILEFAQAVQHAVGTSLPLEYSDLPADDPKRRRPDISRARSILDWEPRVSLEDGIRRTVEYFLARRAMAANPTI
jgi:dTDP-glucose 4,6-dehydratase